MARVRPNPPKELEGDMLVEDLDGVVPGSPDTPKLPFFSTKLEMHVAGRHHPKRSELVVHTARHHPKRSELAVYTAGPHHPKRPEPAAKLAWWAMTPARTVVALWL